MLSKSRALFAPGGLRVSRPLLALAPTKDRRPGFAKPVYAVAGGMSVAAKARPDCVQEEQLLEAVRMMFRDNDLRLENAEELKKYHGIIQASYFADHFEAQLLMGAIAQDAIGFNPMAGWRIEAGGATGGCAVQAAALAVASGLYDYSIVLGWEKMSQVSTNQGTEFIALASDTDFDFEAGGNYTGYYAAMAQEHICNFGTTRKQMAKVAVKNRNQAQFNPYAQTCHKNPFATKNTSGFITAQDVINDGVRPSCSPLHILDCCMMSDAASAMLICNEELAYQLSDHPILLKGMGAGTDTMRTGDRVRQAGALTQKGVFFPDRSLLLPHEETPEIVSRYEKITYPLAHSFLAGRMAAKEAYRMAGIQDPGKELAWLETHDAFTSSEIQAIEDFGLAPYGDGGKFIDTAAWDDSRDMFRDDFPTFGFDPKHQVHVTLSGGLIGARHGVGDTGVFQCIDTMWRLQGKIKKFYGHDAFQPPVKAGTMAADHSHAGTGCYVTVSIWERPEGLPEYEFGANETPVCDEVYARIAEQRKLAESGEGIRKGGKEIAPTRSDVLSPSDPQLGMRYTGSAGATIIHNPYSIDYYHTRGRVTPFFDALGDGKLLATYCPKHGIYLAPIANCRVSECLDDISDCWVDLASAPAYLQTWTSMHYAGPKFKNDLPFHNVLVEYHLTRDGFQPVDATTGKPLPQSGSDLRTSFMSRLKIPSWLPEENIYQGMPIRPKFNTTNPAGRMMDLWYEPAFDQAEWEQKIKPSVPDSAKGMYSDIHGGPRRAK